jgi:hypothetical protein
MTAVVTFMTVIMNARITPEWGRRRDFGRQVRGWEIVMCLIPLFFIESGVAGAKDSLINS